MDTNFDRMSEEEFREATLAHREAVRKLLHKAITELDHRGMWHDQSKFEEPEAPIFMEMTPRMRAMTYGSDEYKACLRQMDVAIRHHYEHNRHHPEHYGTYGISGMNLIDLLEMVCDWIAATERHANGDVWQSLKKNRERYNISPGIMNFLYNTVEWLTGKERPDG